MALAARLAATLAACDSTDDTSAQGTPSAPASASPTPSWDPMAGTTPVTKSAAPTPTAPPTAPAGYDEAKQLLAATPARQTAATKDHKTVKWDVTGVQLALGEIETVVSQGQATAAATHGITVPALEEGDVLEVCISQGARSEKSQMGDLQVWIDGKPAKKSPDGWFKADVVIPFASELHVPGALRGGPGFHLLRRPRHLELHPTLRPVPGPARQPRPLP